MSKKLILFFIIILLKYSIVVHAHPWKPDHFVIIDTDCGFDDFRAINMMLASPSVRVLAIICSNGVISAREGYSKVQAMLDSYYHNGILAGINNLPSSFNNQCTAAIDFQWSLINTDPGNPENHLEIIKKVLKNSTEKITFINLGNLNTFNSAVINIPEFKSRLKKTLWACNYEDLKQNFNYLSDTIAFQSIKKLNLPICTIDGDIPEFSYQKFVNQGEVLSNTFAKNFKRSLLPNKSPYSTKCFDETLVIYLHKPAYFIEDSSKSMISNCKIRAGIKTEEILILIKNMLDGKTSNQNQVFAAFPMDTVNYSDEIQAIMPYCLENYGQDEWIATVLTNEMHRHLGIYAVIGSKMGIRAREYFGAGVDEMQVVSFAGINPPFSCMNDGLQISTGATLGHGLIKIEADSLKLPKAAFIYMNRKICISLKNEYRKRVESEIKNLVMLYGLDTNLYWDLVRNLAIDYWKYWDRHEIFDIKKTN